MSDLDFDELDKAVSTLMGDVSQTVASKDDGIKTLSISSTLSEETRPSLAQLNTELSKVNSAVAVPDEKPTATSVAATSAPTPTPSLAARRGGRFMDVVHPSSDMKGVIKPGLSTSRQGVTIEPVSTVAASQNNSSQVQNAPDTEKLANVLSDDTHASVSDIEPVTQKERETPKNDWPDPLDMSAYTKEPDTNSSTNAANESTPAVATAADDADEAEMQPLVSPFLAGAKVEKRPLGGTPIEEEKTDDESQPHEELGRAPVSGAVVSDDEMIEDASEQLPADPGKVDQPLPPELQSDLMAIETDGGTSSPVDSTPVVPESTHPEAAKDTAPAAVVATPAIEKKPLGEVSTSGAGTATLAGSTSIPQQYHEEPTTSDQTNGAIYDTDSYHQPLAHPAKTKSGWLWIVWILLLLMVGGGGAVALYFLGII